MLRIDVITLFPKIFEKYLHSSIIKRAQQKRLVVLEVHNLRNYVKTRHKIVDEKPYGGGAGMILMADPILKAVDSIKSKFKLKKSKTVVLSAKGRQFDQKKALDWAKTKGQIILISGRYEGIDERVKKALGAEEISIGPYVLTDGDVAAMTLISAITRLIPGVIRKESLKEESFSSSEGEYPQYTRPETLIYKGKKYKVPEVLLTGNHKKIKEWRNKNSR
ncbi:tRNA (guanosine(37)-N1)-methyltransferase TrmD [Candidatus Parcubacteria bacterium]|nr:MAG: tRNA (guanosine(37)-N1)-methyltransferase TrmD [Candidatus Parcubacteria bacterium]